MVIYYSSEQPGAPVLSGAPGQLASLLRAVLVDGFGAAVVSSLAVAADGSATATFTAAHAWLPGSSIRITGAAVPALNDTFAVTATAGLTVTFRAPAGAAAGAVGGTIAARVPPAGWTAPYADGSTICLRSGTPEATGCVLRLDDTDGTFARVRGFESMSDVNAGLGAFPLDAQVSGGGYWLRGQGSAVRRWVVVASDRWVYFMTPPGVNDAQRFQAVFFGDIESAKSGDAYSCLLTCAPDASEFASTAMMRACVGVSSRTNRSLSYMPRAHTGVGGAVVVSRVGVAHNGPVSECYSGCNGYSFAATYPNPPDNGLLLAPVEVIANSGRRGVLPSLFHARSALGAAVPTGVIVAGSGPLVGRNLLSVMTSYSYALAGDQVGGSVFFALSGGGA